jgi:putative membrane protein
MNTTISRFHLALAAAVLAVLAWSGIAPYDRVTWWMEVAPALVALPLMAATYRSYRLTDLLYALIAVHCVILMIGGAYTYARVPIGFDLQHWFELSRNPYDKIGHFAQGFVPAMVAREILLRGRYLAPGKMLAFVVISIVLAISAAYELIEWGAAVALGQGADEFLGTQGDPWDTQSDMFTALIGGVAALLTLTRLHDRQLAAR